MVLFLALYFRTFNMKIFTSILAIWSTILSIMDINAGTDDEVFLRFYNGTTFDEYVEIKLGDALQLLQLESFNTRRNTILYVHGYIETPYSESVQVIVNAYLNGRPNTNIVLLNWSALSAGDYVTNAAKNTKVVGEAAAVKLYELLNSGLQLDLFHLIGHSLGGQVAGYLARYLKNTYDISLKRLTGLDPANPAFYPDGVIYDHVKASDADFVDIIHTDAGVNGAPISTGTVDFWPNNGTPIQPGCPLIFKPLSNDSYCSHWRSWRYYAESVLTPLVFPAVPADSYNDFLNLTTTGGYVYMGIDVDESISGSYYLNTNSKSPYGKGFSGI